MKKFNVKDLYICEVKRYLGESHVGNDEYRMHFSEILMSIIAYKRKDHYEFNKIYYEEIFNKTRVSPIDYINLKCGECYVYSATPITTNKNKITEIEVLNILKDSNALYIEEKQKVKRMDNYGK